MDQDQDQQLLTRPWTTYLAAQENAHLHTVRGRMARSFNAMVASTGKTVQVCLPYKYTRYTRKQVKRKTSKNYEDYETYEGYGQMQRDSVDGIGDDSIDVLFEGNGRSGSPDDLDDVGGDDTRKSGRSDR